MTANTVEAFSRQLQELSVCQSEKSVLLEMKSIVLNSDSNNLRQIIEQCQISHVFNCLNSTDEEQIEISCLIIYNLLKNMKPSDCIKQYSKLLERTLCHPSPRIMIMVLTLLDEMSSNQNVKLIADECPKLLILAAKCLGSTERSVAQGAINLFSHMGQSSEGIKILYSDMILEKFKEVMLIDDITRFRIYEIANGVSKNSEFGLKASEATGLMASLLSEVKSPDTLLQLNALEILSSLGSTTHGYKFLHESGVIQYLSNKIININEEQLSFVLLPGLIEFFGNICKVDPEKFFYDHKDVMKVLFNSLETSDEVLLGVIFSTVGKVGSSSTGKIVLASLQQDMKVFFKVGGELLKNKNDSTVSILNSLTELFTVMDSDTNKLSDTLLVWFNNMGKDALNDLVNLTRLPFVELRLSALNFVNSFAKYPWGAEKICGYPGMTEYLTDRSTEVQKDCKFAKYSIICSLLECHNVDHYVNEETLNRLKEYAKEGPFYVPISPELMTEGAS